MQVYVVVVPALAPLLTILVVGLNVTDAVVVCVLADVVVAVVVDVPDDVVVVGNVCIVSSVPLGATDTECFVVVQGKEDVMSFPLISVAFFTVAV